MKVCVIGAGAIGGWVGARLAAFTGAEVTAVARCATLAALREHGWRLHTADGWVSAPVHATDSAGELGEQDLIVIAVKATALTSVLPHLPALTGPSTTVLPLMNGVPWWFVPGGEPLRSVDPDGEIAAAIDLGRVVGGVVYGTAATVEPGVTRHVKGERIVVGEPFAGVSPRARRVGDLLASAGFDVTRLRRHPARDLVQALGQHDDQPDHRADRRDRRPPARRPVGA